ncbi:MAG: DUF2769 domain-containing protein [Candidatus Methylarchaceae archaeon HK02M2]|nr:DUF2769 domain-containing protein [Candidatus Methylarchaceae archaeon HK02M2]
MKVPDNKENLMKCICTNCPTHNDCMKERKQGLFCARVKSDCDLERQGCICGQCPISSEYRLSKMYYCEIGAAE